MLRVKEAMAIENNQGEKLAVVKRL